MRRAFEIRLHGRGGQGGVTCAKILAAAYARMGRSVRTFGDYAGERSGAPVRAYTDVSDQPITSRNKLYQPDHLVVLDPSLLGDDVLDGLAPGGTLILNTPEELESFAGRFEEVDLAIVDATAIARRHGIGTRSVVIVNTTIAGAYARVHGIPLGVLEETYDALGLASNLEAALEAHRSVRIRPARSKPAEHADSPDVFRNGGPVEPLTTPRESASSGLRTGSWSTRKPRYVKNIAPCNAWCPAGNDVVGFVQAAGRGDTPYAAHLLGASTPLAAVCGRVCPAPCMLGCNRRQLDGSVNIRALERWVADHTLVAVGEVSRLSTSHSFAIVGSGPAGLSAAYHLARLGQQVTILEGESELGGILRTGIPDYRLPRTVLDREIAAILALGIEVRCGQFLSTRHLEQVSREQDAVILATGLQQPRELQVPGAELPGIQQGIHFLHRFNLEGPTELSGSVVVLGGGNTAVDCARSALRSGAEHVTLAYRRTRAEMPAIGEEIDQALAEGVEILLQRQPIGFLGEGTVTGVDLATVEMGEPDASSRPRPLVTDRHAVLPCDHVLLALGQSRNLGLLPAGWKLVGNRLWQDDQALFVFAAGDLATGDGTVAHAVGNGRRVAGLALRALGEEVEVFERADRAASVPVTDIRLDHFARRKPAVDDLEPAATRVRSSVEVNHGLADASEAQRCFSCGNCTRCDTCLVYCPEGIIRRDEDGYGVDYTYCKGCGICVQECPRSAMEMVTP